MLNVLYIYLSQFSKWDFGGSLYICTQSGNTSEDASTYA